MKKIIPIIVIIAFMIAGSGSVSSSEEQLFDTKTAGIYLEKGIAHLKAKKYDAAITELEESLSIYPDAESFYYLGYAFYMKGKAGDTESRKKAMENFEKAYELDPHFTPNKDTPIETIPALDHVIPANTNQTQELVSKSVDSNDLEQKQ